MMFPLMLAYAADIPSAGDPVFAAAFRIADATERHFWGWYADDPCGGHDRGLFTYPEPGHPFTASMDVRRALAAATTLHQVAEIWNQTGGRRFRVDIDDPQRVVVTLMGLDESCTQEVGPNPAYLHTRIAPALYVGQQGVRDMLSQLPHPVVAGLFHREDARWIVREPTPFIDVLFNPAPGQVGTLNGNYHLSSDGPFFALGGNLGPPDPEDPPPPPPPTEAEKLLAERRLYLHHVNTVAAGILEEEPGLAYYLDLIPAEKRNLEIREAKWIAKHGALPYDPETVVGYPLPHVGPIVPQRFTGTFPLPPDDTPPKP